MLNTVTIRIAWGSSEGPTKISSFDGALNKAGIHNLNLINLSSIIPPRADVVEVGRIQQKEPVGSIGKVVMSHIEGVNCWITSGLGWAVAEEGGILVEGAKEGRSVDCKGEIRKGLENMMERRSWTWISKPRVRTIEAKARSDCFSSVVVAALYGIEPLVSTKNTKVPREISSRKSF